MEAPVKTPYIDARTAARLFGCSYAQVVESIQLGKQQPSAPIASLISDGRDGVYVIEPYQVNDVFRPIFTALFARATEGNKYDQA